MAVPIAPVAMMAGGLLFLWSGFHGASLTGSLRDLLQGKQPGPDPNLQISDQPGLQSIGSGDPGSGGSSGTAAASGGGSATDGHAALNQAAAAYGWNTGSEWAALSYVEMREAGFNRFARNPSSGALGIAQALGHGTANTAGSLGNEYGGNGLTDAQARAANSGNAYWQSVWMVNYIHDRYGTPSAAAAHERADNWY